jgi:hypothetical protein
VSGHLLRVDLYAQTGVDLLRRDFLDSLRDALCGHPGVLHDNLPSLLGADRYHTVSSLLVASVPPGEFCPLDLRLHAIYILLSALENSGSGDSTDSGLPVKLFACLSSVC